MDQSSNYPPAIQLLFSEGLHQLTSGSALLEALNRRGLGKDLRNQAEYSIREWPYADVKATSPSGEFVVAPSNSLSPMMLGNKCPALSCRLNSARRFARSVGLYADRAMIVDSISPELTGDGVTNDRVALHILGDLRAIEELDPLFKAGVLSFTGPGHAFCEHCQPQLTEVGRNVTEKLLRTLLEDASVVNVLTGRNHAMVEVMLPAYDATFKSVELQMSRVEAKPFASLCHGRRPRKLPPHLLEKLQAGFRDDVANMLKTLAAEVVSAEKTGAVVVAGMRAEAQTLRYLLDAVGPKAQINDWERARSVSLPWINELSVANVVQLRAQAKRALPVLRTRLAKELSQGSETTVESVASDLAFEAAEVEAELDACSSASGGGVRFSIVSLGLAFVLYGLHVGGGPGIAATAIGTLVAALNAMHPQAAKEKLEGEKLRGKPAFALVKARELLHRAHPSH